MKKIIKALARILCNVKTIGFCRKVRNWLVWNAYAAKFQALGEGSVVGAEPRLRGMQYMRIGNRFSAGNGLLLQAWDHYAGQNHTPCLTIGDDVMLTDYIQISCAHSITIGNRVLMGQNVYISDNDHGTTDYDSLCRPPLSRELATKGPVVIEDDVWIGRNATILSGVTIGKGAVIAANSVVNKDVPAYAVAGGIPARVLKHPSQER